MKRLYICKTLLYIKWFQNLKFIFRNSKSNHRHALSYSRTKLACYFACKQTLLSYDIDLFTTPHKVVHNGGSLNFKGLLFDKKTNYLAQILQCLSYKMCSITLPKFNTFGLFIPILGTSAIMDQTACCYNVTTSETGLYYVNTELDGQSFH